MSVGDEQHGDLEALPHVGEDLLHDEPVCASSAPNGSSSSRIRGPVASALTMPTRCFMPPDSPSG